MKAAVEPFDLKPRGLDCRFGVSRRLAPTERTGPEERVERVLDQPERRVLRANVLPEAKLTAGQEDSPQLGERGGRVGDAAENPHHNGGVERTVIRRQRP